MNAPRLGSTAKACTLVRMPDRTRNVPIIDIENATTASITVHARNPSRVASTVTEWSSAVAASHGISDAFSTGPRTTSRPSRDRNRPNRIRGDPQRQEDPRPQHQGRIARANAGPTSRVTSAPTANEKATDSPT